MTPQGLTSVLTEAVVSQWASPLPAKVANEARRSLLNVLATSIGASRQPAVDIVIAHALDHGGSAVAPVPGRPERTDVLNAALATGTAAHLDDFDDTHLETVIHPGAATMAASLAVGVPADVSGGEMLTAFALGCESQLRVGVAMSPSHYDAGWHITGTCGVIGAAVSSALLLGLTKDQLAHAIAIASSQTLGVREAFGTMTKPYHPGKAAANGILAAKLAHSGFTGAPDALENPHGFFHVLADELDASKVTDGWGSHWELLRNTYKPYPCGIVIHPVIDAAIALQDQLHAGMISRIDEVIVHCHPLVAELTGNPDPSDGLEARFSAVHGAAAGLADGEVGLSQYSDERVRAADLIELRAKTRLEVDEGLERDAASVSVVIDGAVQSHGVEHARGSLAQPLTDDELRGKVEGLVEPILPNRTASLVSAVAELAKRGDLGDLVQAVTPLPMEVSA